MPFTPDQQHVLTLISEGHTATAAAADAGIHRNTVRNWQLTNPEFAEATSTATRNPASQLTMRATALLEAALDDPATSQAQKLRIALAIVRMGSFRKALSTPPPMHKMNNPEPAKPAPILPIAEKISIPRTTHNPIRAAVTPSRNSQCPCNSGLKFKRCCAQKSPA